MIIWTSQFMIDKINEAFTEQFNKKYKMENKEIKKSKKEPKPWCPNCLSENVEPNKLGVDFESETRDDFEDDEYTHVCLDCGTKFIQ